VPGNVLNAGWFFVGSPGWNPTDLSGIYFTPSDGNIFYNPDSTTAGSYLIANVGTAAMTNADFVYGV